MNFMEAVGEMKKGKKVRRSIWMNGMFIFLSKYNNFIREDDQVKNIYLLDIESTDWEVVDDKEWNLAEQDCDPIEDYNGKGCSSYHYVADVKKCRDLILKDIEEYFQKGFDFSTYNADDIVKKRFGDL